MIGTELLQLLQGDPLAQMRQQMAGPNPNPQAPPPAAAPMQRAPGPQQLKNIPGSTGAIPGTGLYSRPPPRRLATPPQGVLRQRPAALRRLQPALPQSGPSSVASQSPPGPWLHCGHAPDATAAVWSGDRPRPPGPFDGASAYAAPGTQGPDHALDGQPAARRQRDDEQSGAAAAECSGSANLPQPGSGGAGAGGQVARSTADGPLEPGRFCLPTPSSS